jgi:hypothetical protein
MWAAALLLVLAPLEAGAQEPHRHHGPSAGLHQRPLKALSEQQIADLRAGKGMSLALAAELNGYPGPLHVLELADKLTLSTEQRERVEQLYEAMKKEAIAAGEQLIGSEHMLDEEFAAGTINPERLAALTARIGAQQGALRAVHLRYHLLTADLLNAHQRQRYGELRGYR